MFYQKMCFCKLGNQCSTFCPLRRFVLQTFCPWDILSLGPYVWGPYVPGTFCHLGRFVIWDVLYAHRTVYLSSNFNSGSDRLCEGIGQTRRKDDSFDSTLAIFIQLIIIYAIYSIRYRKAVLHAIRFFGIELRKEKKRPREFCFFMNSVMQHVCTTFC